MRKVSKVTVVCGAAVQLDYSDCFWLRRKMDGMILPFAYGTIQGAKLSAKLKPVW